MGVTRLTYCGPYVECKVSKMKSTFRKSRCSNPACEQHTTKGPGHRDKFCGKCGSAFETVDVEKEVDAVDPCELVEKFDGAIWQPFGGFASKLSEQGRHIWLGDQQPEDIGDKPRRSFFVSHEVESLRELQAADVEGELKQFHRNYDEELNRLRSVYGPANVQVKWGLVQIIHC